MNVYFLCKQNRKFIQINNCRNLIMIFYVKNANISQLHNLFVIFVKKVIAKTVQVEYHVVIKL